MSGIKVLITDPNETLRENLAELLRARFTVKTSGDGIEALSLLKEFAPDILVTDLMLPGIDGFYLLEQAYQMDSPPEVVVVTRHLSSYVHEKVLSFGIHSMLRKPYDLMAAEANVRAIAKRVPVSFREKETAAVSELLLQLGFQSHRDGYNQLLLAVPMFAKDTRQPVNKVIYTAIAKEFGLSGHKPV
jgi:two-component system response regulator (stage 0 sporulation protein A)